MISLRNLKIKKAKKPFDTEEKVRASRIGLEAKTKNSLARSRKARQKNLGCGPLYGFGLAGSKKIQQKINYFFRASVIARKKRFF